MSSLRSFVDYLKSSRSAPDLASPELAEDEAAADDSLADDQLVEDESGDEETDDEETDDEDADDEDADDEEADDEDADDETTDDAPDVKPGVVPPSPKPLDKNTAANIKAGVEAFGSGSKAFATLKKAKDLNPRQKTIFDDKLKAAIAKDPRANAGAMSEADLKALAEQAAEVTDKLSKTTLGDQANQLAAKSETLKDNIVDLQNQGWTIKFGEAGKGSFTDKPSKTIVMDPNDKDKTKTLIEGLAHESGHAEYTAPADPPIADRKPTAAKGREYIRKVVENNLLDEGQAQIVACKTAAELEAKGEKDLQIPGGHSDEYKKVYAKIAAGKLTTDQGRIEMAKIMATETTSNTNENYVDYYAAAARENWNKAHPKATVPDPPPQVVVFP